MELQGRIILALPRKSGESARGTWEAQDFVIETNDNFPRKVVFSVFGSERLQRFNIQEGQQVLVSFDIDAHEYQGRWYNSVRAYDVRPLEATAQMASPASEPFPPAPPAPVSQVDSAEPQAPGAAPAAPQQPDIASTPVDDLPF